MEGSAKFIVLEGIDTQELEDQGERLYSRMREERLKVHLTREPSDGPFGSQIRLILDGRMKVDEKTLALFFATDRMDHLNKTDSGILARLESGEHVICLRYYLSSFAYQAIHSDLKWLRWINSACRSPDLTLFLDTPVDIYLEGFIKRGDFRSERNRQVEKKNLIAEERRRQERIRSNYLEAIRNLREERKRENIVRVEGNRPASAVEKEIWRAVITLMEKGHDL